MYYPRSIASPPPPFPRPVTTFVGRERELERALELLEREPLFLVYGVGGIGKSELVFRIAETTAGTAPWTQAPPILVEVQPHFRIAHVTALLGERLGVRLRGDTDERQAIAHSLERAPRLVFIDDVHHLDPDAVAELLAYLARHVRASRIFVGSRVELPIPEKAPAPVVLRLQALDSVATARMVELLATRLGIEVEDAETIHRSTNGSPFFIQRELAKLGGVTQSERDAIADAVAELSHAARDVLARAAVMHTRLPRSEADPDGLAELQKRFLIELDGDSVSVHDLIRDAVVAHLPAAELQRAHRASAELALRRHATAETKSALDLVEAVHQRAAAGELEEAWELLDMCYGDLAAAGVDHLVLDELELLAGALDERLPIALLQTRILVRRSMIAEANAVLRKVSAERGAAGSFGYLRMAGEIAERTGKPEHAERMFRRALAAADNAADRFQAALQLALVASLRGSGEEAREVLDAAWAEVGEPTARQRSRWGWTLAVSYTFQERFDEAARAAAETAEAIKGRGLADHRIRLAMVEVGALIEIDELARARELMENVLAAAASAGSLREHVAALHRGMVLAQRGFVRKAHPILERVFEYFAAHGDSIYTSISGYYLAASLRELGELDAAAGIADRTLIEASEGGLRSHAARTMVMQASLAIDNGNLDEAAKRARWALRDPGLTTRSRAFAHCTLARALALQGSREAALSELAQATQQVEASQSASLAQEIDLERCELALLLEDAETAIARAEQARNRYAAGERELDKSRAGCALAAAYIAAGGDANLILAEKELGSLGAAPVEGPRALELALLAAAIATRRSEAERARELLTSALRNTPLPASHPTVAAVRAALDPDHAAAAAPGVRAYLVSLGVTAAGPHDIVDRAGSRAASQSDLDAARKGSDLVVETQRGVITGKQGRVSVHGRPTSLRLLSTLIESQGQIVTAETFFRRVWGRNDYHPLKHRNTVYVAMNRLRKTLREIYPERAIIETAAEGWRIDSALDACIIHTAGAEP